MILLSAKDRERPSVSKVWRYSISARQRMLTLENSTMLKSRKASAALEKLDISGDIDGPRKCVCLWGGEGWLPKSQPRRV